MFRSDSSTTTWLGIRWEGPPDGAVIAIDCSGQILAAARIGYTLRMIRWPSLAGSSEVTGVEVISGSGTGSEERFTVLLSREGSTFRRLWSSVTYERDQSMPSRGGAVRQLLVTPSAAGDTIFARGFELRLSHRSSGDTWSTVDSVSIVPTKACWNRVDRVFAPC